MALWFNVKRVVYIPNDTGIAGWLLGWRWMLDLKLHIINKNELQTKYSKTKSLEKVQYFPPEKQAPWVPSSARSNRRPRCSKPGRSTLGRGRQWLLCPKILSQNEPVATLGQCMLWSPLPHGKLLHAWGSYLISPDLNFLTHKRLWRFNEMTEVTHLKEFLAHSKCPVNVSYDYCYYYHYEYIPCFPLSGYHVKPTGHYQKTSSPSVPDIKRFSSNH